jgi:MoaA/NifB/PqqE/SkfB family radical SAM enzyme
MNPEMIAMAAAALRRGYEVLILTNAMRPMMRPRCRPGLALWRDFGDRLTLRISLDHWQEARHDEERGPGSFGATLEGMRWLRDAGIAMAVAGRTLWDETEAEARAGYARLYAERGASRSTPRDPGQTGAVPRNGRRRRGARDHHRLLGYPWQIART